MPLSVDLVSLLNSFVGYKKVVALHQYTHRGMPPIRRLPHRNMTRCCFRLPGVKGLSPFRQDLPRSEVEEAEAQAVEDEDHHAEAVLSETLAPDGHDQVQTPAHDEALDTTSTTSQQQFRGHR